MLGVGIAFVIVVELITNLMLGDGGWQRWLVSHITIPVEVVMLASKPQIPIKMSLKSTKFLTESINWTDTSRSVCTLDRYSRLHLFVFYMMLGLGFRWWLAISTWLIASWILTGKKSFAFINKWYERQEKIGSTGIRSGSVRLRYLEAKVCGENSPVRFRRISSVESFMPFQKHSHLHQILQIEIGGHSFLPALLRTGQGLVSGHPV